MDRRDFLKLGAAGGLTLAGTSGMSQARQPASEIGRRARNLIFMVSDGMSIGTLTLAEIASRKRHAKSSHWVSLFTRQGVRRAAQSTHSADSIVTDSAAAASAWGCGHKVNNGAVNITPDGVQQVPLLVRASQNSKAIGLVTTARVTHATPAGFIANAPQRNLEKDIARQILQRGVNVALGGGAKHFSPELLREHPDVTLVANRAELDAAADKSGRLLGLFTPSHASFELDRPDTEPSLADMTRVALRRLAQHPDGFVMQIEGGRVDHAAHSNDAASLVADQLAFDQAIGEVLRFVEGRDDTLVVITTDHGNANPGLTLYNAEAEKGLDRLLQARKSFDWINTRLGSGNPASQSERLSGAVEEALGVTLGVEDRLLVERSLKGERVMPFGGLNNASCVLGSILANSFGVSFISGNHTSDQVELTAIGPGSETIPGEVDNAELHEIVASVLGLAPGKPLPGMEVIVDRVKPPPPD